MLGIRCFTSTGSKKWSPSIFPVWSPAWSRSDPQVPPMFRTLHGWEPSTFHLKFCFQNFPPLLVGSHGNPQQLQDHPNNISPPSPLVGGWTTNPSEKYMIQVKLDHETPKCSGSKTSPTKIFETSFTTSHLDIAFSPSMNILHIQRIRVTYQHGDAHGNHAQQKQKSTANSVHQEEAANGVASSQVSSRRVQSTR